MYLKRLEIQGFKSFAKKTVLEFQQGVTSIVGPNGSGKSNVADCLRWVLGEQSSKMMRGKKSDDVIFAGSDKKTKLGFAEVFATFDNHDRKIPLDVAEVSIGRRVDRSGESEYLINGSRVRLLDIVDLVLKSNIGTSRYTVIGQGTIDQMILAGPSEVKNLIDEASGVKTYYIKREKTLRRLEQTTQNLMRAEDLIVEIEPRLKSLRRQAKRMEARESLETELKTLRQEWFSHQFWNLKESSENLSSKISGMKEAVKQEVEGKMEELKKDLESANLKHKQATDAKHELHNAVRVLDQKLQVLYQELQKPHTVDWKEVEKELFTLDESFAALQKALSLADSVSLQNSAEKLSESWQSFRKVWKAPGENSLNLQELKQQLMELSSQKDKLNAELSQLAVKESEARQSADFIRQQIHALHQQGQKSDIHSQLEIEKAKVDTQIESLMVEIKSLMGDESLHEIAKQKPHTPLAHGVHERIEKLQHQLYLIGGVDELTIKEFKETEDRYNSLSAQIDDLKKGMADLRQIMDELDEKIKHKFNEAFHKINEKFEHYFRILFNGGRAYLSVLRQQESGQEQAEDDSDQLEINLEENLRPEERMLSKYERASGIIGVDMKATPPGKKLSSIQALSGGERALTSIAFLCSLLTCFPSPFVVLDEVDAALDDANTIRFGQILGTLSHQTQFITITHNRETMALSNTLYGITMGDDGVSKLLSIRFDQAKAYAK